MSDSYNSRIARFVGWLNRAKFGYAVTISSTCTLYSCAPEQVTADWRRHELVHQRQYRELGWYTFMRRYLWYNLTKGYQSNPFEIEARNG
jgi:hypothetical protein